MFAGEPLKDRVVVVTGGGTGLGRKMVEIFLQNGALCVIAGRREEVLRTAAEEMDPSGERLMTQVCDVSFLPEVEDLVEAAYERFGKVDILVNNAAGNYISATERLRPSAFRKIVDIVLMGTINCTTMLGQRWIEEKHKGVVLNILTTYAETGSGYVVPSACAKAGVATLTRSLAAEWGSKYGMRFVAIAPGPFPTEGAWERLVPSSWVSEEAIDRIPMRRFGRHEELGNLAAFLVSDYASYINGEVIRIDGGELNAMAGQFNMLKNVTEEGWQEFEGRRRTKRSKKPPVEESADS